MIMSLCKGASAAVLAFVAAGVCVAGPSRHVLIDESARTVSGARERMAFERLADEGERVKWAARQGRSTAIGTSVLSATGAVVGGASGALIGVGLAQAHAQARRNASIQPLRAAVERARMDSLIQARVVRSLEARGIAFAPVQWALKAQPAYFQRAGLADGSELLVIEKAGMPIVALSWDDRTPLVSMVKRSARVRTLMRGDVVSEGVSCELRYVGTPAPDGLEPVDYWSRNGGRPFLDAVESGVVDRILAVDCGEVAALPRPGRDAMTELDIGGRRVRYPGALWKQVDGVAYLRTRDGGITLVVTG